jgi:hypothetical protein
MQGSHFRRQSIVAMRLFGKEKMFSAILNDGSIVRSRTPREEGIGLNPIQCRCNHDREHTFAHVAQCRGNRFKSGSVRVRILSWALFWKVNRTSDTGTRC